MRSPFIILISLTGAFIGCAGDPEVLTPAQSAMPVDESAVGDFTEPSDESTQATSEEDSVTAQNTPTEYNKLTEFEEYVLEHKGTEPRGVGEYTDTEDAGTYICRRCNAELYKSDHKFHSGCGWPAFDDEIKGAVERVPDADGERTEIICTNCKGHLGHVFIGERFTSKNTRHCVNSVSMILIPEGQKIPPTIRLENQNE